MSEIVKLLHFLFLNIKRGVKLYMGRPKGQVESTCLTKGQVWVFNSDPFNKWFESRSPIYTGYPNWPIRLTQPNCHPYSNMFRYSNIYWYILDYHYPYVSIDTLMDIFIKTWIQNQTQIESFRSIYIPYPYKLIKAINPYNFIYR